MYIKFSLLGLSVLAAIVFILLRVKKGGVAGLLGKAVASFSFIALAAFSFLTLSNDLAGILILLGLLSGLVGDILLDLKVMNENNFTPYLNSGMISFFIGHIFYIFGVLVLVGFNISLTFILIAILASIVITALIFIVSGKMKLNFGKFLIQSISYALILVFMTILTIYLAVNNSIFIVLSVGMGLFLLSDLVLSMQYFGGKEKNKVMIVVNHSLYYAAQICIAMFVYLI